MPDKRITAHGIVEPSCMCCGLSEYDGLNKPGFTVEGALAAIFQQGYLGNSFEDRGGDSFCQVVMTQMVEGGTKVPKETNLDKFVKYVEKNKLGSIGTSAFKQNPNSGNKVKGAIYAPSLTALRRWASENGVECEKPYRWNRWY